MWTVGALALGGVLAVVASLSSSKKKGYRGQRIGK
jgi:hypothetical protein